MKNIIAKIGVFISNIVMSLDNIQHQGYSARKLTGLSIMICVLLGHYIYYKHCFDKQDFSIFSTILIIDYCAVAFFLGLVTVEQIIKLKNENSNDKAPTDTTV